MQPDLLPLQADLGTQPSTIGHKTSAAQSKVSQMLLFSGPQFDNNPTYP